MGRRLNGGAASGECPFVTSSVLAEGVIGEETSVGNKSRFPGFVAGDGAGTMLGKRNG